MSKVNKEWVPEYKHETLKGTFVDYCGNERDFTMVAVSIPLDECDSTRVVRTEMFENEINLPDRVVENEHGEIVDFNPGGVTFYQDEMDVLISPVTKMLSVGVSVRAVSDKDTNISERIAYGKAVKLKNHTLYVSHPGMINTKMVQALLEQEAEHFKKDPGSYIVNYNHDKFRFEKTGIIAEPEKNVKAFPNSSEISVKARLKEEVQNI
jgi:hypothetical protein